MQLDSGEDVVIKVEESLWRAAEAFKHDFEFHEMETKIHRFPPGLRGLGDRYIVPTVVAIGPYHRNLLSLHKMAKVKDAAAHHFIDAMSSAYRKIYYGEFFPVAVKARSSYARDAVEGITDADFVNMMLRDACFLLQYMLCMASSRGCGEKYDVNPSLRRFFFSNRACIDNDVMLLENQLPWTVLDALRKFSSVKIEAFVAEMGKRFRIREDLEPEESFVLDSKIYTPPHLLGLLRFYKLGRKAPNPPVPADDGKNPDDVVKDGDEPVNKKSEAAHGHGLKQVSVSNAIEHLLGLLRYYKLGRKAPNTDGDRLVQVSEPISASMLARNGIKLRASKATELNKKKVRKGFLFDEFFISPLYVDGTTASWLVNMVAYEVCTAIRFAHSNERTAVCSYLALLAMLMKEERDVHEMRAKGFLHGEFTDKKMLVFFNMITDEVSPGPGYFQVLASIEACKRRRLRWIPAYKFVCDNYKTIATVLSIISVLIGIFKTLFSLKQHQQ